MHVLATQFLKAFVRRGETVECHRAAPPVERRISRLRPRSAERGRIGPKHQADDVVDKWPQQEDRPGLRFDQRDPMKRADRWEIEAEIDGANDVMRAVSDRSMHGGQRKARGAGAERRVAAARACGGVPEPRRVVLMDHKPFIVDPQRRRVVDVPGKAQMPRQCRDIELLQFLQMLRGSAADLEFRMRRRARADNTPRLVLHRHRQPGFPHRQAQIGLVEYDGRQVEVALLRYKAKRDAGVDRLVLDRLQKVLQVVALYAEKVAVTAEIFTRRKARRRRPGDDIAVLMRNHAGDAGVGAPYDPGVSPRVQLLVHGSSLKQAFLQAARHFISSASANIRARHPQAQSARR